METQKTKDANAELHPSTAFRDLAVLISATILVFILSYFFNTFALIIKFLQEHPDKMLYIDEAITTLLTLSIGFAVFAWRRWLELKKETAERLKIHEELLEIATTEAQIEKIISKQLRLDMDQMKQDVREILHALHKAYKRSA